MKEKIFFETFKSTAKSKPLKNPDKNVIRHLMIVITIVDFWLVNILGKWLRRLIKSLKPILEFFFIMFIGAALILIYILINANMKKSNSNEMMAITDESDPYSSLLAHEILRLRAKTISMEMTIKKLDLQVKSLSVNKQMLEMLPDFASESAGGSVIDTPDTETYQRSNQMYATIFGIPIWKPNYFTPRKIIQPWTGAGECYAFRGSNGNFVIELVHLTVIDQVTMEHIPRSASLTGSIDSAPKEFRLLGKFRDKYVTLGTFLYDDNGPSCQTFSVTKEDVKQLPVKIVMLQILSNWGNPDYTCVYRFRVHGKAYDTDDFIFK